MASLSLNPSKPILFAVLLLAIRMGLSESLANVFGLLEIPDLVVPFSPIDLIASGGAATPADLATTAVGSYLPLKHDAAAGGLPMEELETTMNPQFLLEELETSMNNPEFESEVLLDASHFFLDFLAFLTKNKPILQRAQIVGRLLVLAQDYIPDHCIRIEEFSFQVFLIGVAMGGLEQQPRSQPTKSDTTTIHETEVQRNTKATVGGGESIERKNNQPWKRLFQATNEANKNSKHSMEWKELLPGAKKEAKPIEKKEFLQPAKKETTAVWKA